MLAGQVQVLTKEGEYSGTFQGLVQPRCVCYDLLELFYVGDDYAIKIFTRDGTLFQRLGGYQSGNGLDQFWLVFSVCVMDDQLYVYDRGNRRIQIFERQ